MKKKQNLTILLSAVIMISLICGTAFAKQPTPPTPPPPTPVCGGLTGTWHGEQPGDMVWLALHTSDSLDPTKGEMLMNWIDTQFLGPNVSLTPGHGVWQLNSDDNYNYTWYAFGTYLDDENTLNTMTLRVSGVAGFDQNDCNTVQIYYVIDYVTPAVPVGELGTATFYSFDAPGYAKQTRVPLVVTPYQE
jgi:hypothetical protein